MLNAIKWILVLNLLSMILCQTNYAQNEFKLPKGSDLLLLKMDYEGIVRQDIIAITYNKKTYVPLLEILSNLKIIPMIM